MKLKDNYFFLCLRKISFCCFLKGELSFFFIILNIFCAKRLCFLMTYLYVNIFNNLVIIIIDAHGSGFFIVFITIALIKFRIFIFCFTFLIELEIGTCISVSKSGQLLPYTFLFSLNKNDITVTGSVFKILKSFAIIKIA